jgi:hypothetical protein
VIGRAVIAGEYLTERRRLNMKGMKTADGIGAAAKGMRPVLLLAPCLFLASVGVAQTKTDELKAATASHTPSATVNSWQSPPAAKTAELKAAPSAAPAKGTHEGIKVHGYWTIDVRNPDGKVTAHREFENAVQGGGQSFLGGALGAEYSPGGMAIALNGAYINFVQQVIYPGPAGQQSTSPTAVYIPDPSNIEPGPCGQLLYNFFPNDESYVYLTSLLGNPSGTPCIIAELQTQTNNGGAAITLPGSWCAGPGHQKGCSTNLVVTPPQGSSPLTLSGSMVVPDSVSAGSVNDVETILTQCDTNTTPFNCANYWNRASGNLGVNGWPVANANLLTPVIFTLKELDSQNGDPAPVPYQPGQTIAVTVQISFQ